MSHRLGPAPPHRAAGLGLAAALCSRLQQPASLGHGDGQGRLRPAHPSTVVEQVGAELQGKLMLGGGLRRACTQAVASLNGCLIQIGQRPFFRPGVGCCCRVQTWCARLDP